MSSLILGQADRFLMSNERIMHGDRFPGRSRTESPVHEKYFATRPLKKLPNELASRLFDSVVYLTTPASRQDT